jgi:FADH2 O2-dependent halogenase
MMAGLHVVVVGAGFAGAILARVLVRQGHEVSLLERGTHPRFALGESATPLAAISLERLAERYGLKDLHHLAAYGRWLRHLPEVRRGLKRGFTFYAHQPGRRYQNDGRNRCRMLVAASPEDRVADAHWLRADLDAHLVDRAAAEGVAYADRTEVVGLEPHGAGLRVTAKRHDVRLELEADLVVDASGAGGALARLLALPSDLGRVELDTGVLYGHFADVRPFAEAAAGAELPTGPYPDERAAVHHMLGEGWMYALPFDHGVVSAGFVVEAGARRDLRRLPPDEAWQRMLSRYPTLQEQFGNARAVRPIGAVERLQRRVRKAAGPNWALLPFAYCFLSPLFSTGIAWTLLGIERLSLVLETVGSGRNAAARLERGLARYAVLLEAEADHLDRLLTGAYRARVDFDVFCAYSYLYFAAVSYAEAAQRLLPAPSRLASWAWDGFAGSSDPVMRHAVVEARRLLGREASGKDAPPGAVYFDAVRSLIRPRNIAGLANPDRKRLYPADQATLVQQAALLGLEPKAAERALPRLRGGPGL